MKRSEALKIIKKELENNFEIPGGFRNKFPSSLEIAAISHDILYRLEEAGMLPPHTIITGTKDELEGHIQNCQWESEN